MIPGTVQDGLINASKATIRRFLVPLEAIIGPGFALTLVTMQPTSADIRVFSCAAPQSGLQDFAREFERATGHRTEFTFRLVSEIQQRLAAGEKADLIMLPVPLIAATEMTIPLRTEGRTVLARMEIGIIVSRGTTPPDISTPASTKQDARQCPGNRMG